MWPDFTLGDNLMQSVGQGSYSQVANMEMVGAGSDQHVAQMKALKKMHCGLCTVPYLLKDDTAHHDMFFKDGEFTH